MTFDPPLDHEALLTLTRKAEAAARDGDRHRVETETLQLFEAFVDHVGAEHLDLTQVAPGESRLLQRGQQRVVGRLVELAVAATGDPSRCRCDDLAQQLLAELSLQADDERLAGIRGRRLP